MEYLVIGFGGAIGALVRYGAGNLVTIWLGTQYPWSTLFFNLTGSLLIGFIQRSERLHRKLGRKIILGLTTGFLGAYTTFSAFSMETLELWSKGQNILAIGYILASILGGLLGVWVGSTGAKFLDDYRPE